MTLRRKHWRGSSGRAALLVTTALLVPLPAFAAGGPPASAPTKAPHMSLSQAVTRTASTTTLAPAARHDDQGSTMKQSSGFFHSRPGMIALAIMAGGTGYAVYSVSHDRIKSPGKK